MKDDVKVWLNGLAAEGYDAGSQRLVTGCGKCLNVNNNNNNNNSYFFLTAIGLLPGGSGYFTCIQNMKMVTNNFKSGGLHGNHVVATWNLGNHLSICL